MGALFQFYHEKEKSDQCKTSVIKAVLFKFVFTIIKTRSDCIYQFYLSNFKVTTLI